MVGALSQSVVERWLGASVAQPGRCFSTPESIRLVSGKAKSIACPAGSRVQTPPEAPKTNRRRSFASFLFRTTAHATRDGVAKTPCFLETICCLAWIPGESRDSGLRLGLDGRAESRE